MKIIEAENLNFAYGQQVILKNLSFKIDQGTFLAIAGPNGAGKTTLLNLLCGLLKLQTGSIKIVSSDISSFSIRELAKKIAVVRQDAVPVFDFTVEETISMARTPYVGTFGFESEIDRNIIKHAMQLTDTDKFSDRPIGHLSGGERQRVFIARALAQDTPILLLDEPTNFLDLKNQVAIFDLLKSAQLEKGKTIVIVTHDLNLANQYCDNTLLLGSNGSFLYGKIDEVLSTEQVQKFFDINTFGGQIDKKKFFIPLGRFAKDFGAIKNI